MKFALYDFIEGAIDRLVMKSNDKGGYSTARVTFLPHTDYETTDPVLIKYLKGEIGDVNQKSLLTKDLESELKANGVKYEVKKCGTCPSAKPKAVYNPFRIVEE